MFGRLSVKSVSDYQGSVDELCKLVRKSQLSPIVVETARRIVADCPARDDDCERQAIFSTVKHGNPAIPGLERGVRYTSDPQSADFFTTPERLLETCKRGACGEDCDGLSLLVASLCAAVGHTVGLTIWKKDKRSTYEHIYAVALKDKRSPIGASKDFSNVIAMDTSTVNQPGFDLDYGQHPPYGQVRTYWVMTKGAR